MKQGDTVPVTIAGQVVAQATVKELGDGEVTLVVPGTLVRMAVRTEIAPEVQTVEESSSETIITGVDRVSDTGEVLSSTDAGGTPEVPRPPVTAPSSEEVMSTDTAQQQVEAAPVVETVQENINTTVSDNESQ